METSKSDFSGAMAIWKATVKPMLSQTTEPSFGKPKLTPDWVWQQYIKALNGYGGSNFFEALDKLVLKADERQIWKPLQKRSDLADERWSQGLTISKRNYGFTGERPSDIVIISRIYESVKVEISGYHLYTKSMRRSSGRTIEKCSRLLADELEAMIDKANLLPDLLEEKYGYERTEGLDSLTLIKMLRELSEAGGKWALTPPVLTKPNQGDSQRTIFIQKVTSYLLQTYGQPLRGVALGLTCIFFEGSEHFTESDISQIAPVPK